MIHVALKQFLILFNLKGKTSTKNYCWKSEFKSWKQSENWNQILNSKQTINQTSDIVSTSKNWKEFIETKKINQTNTISFVSTQ